MINPAQYQKVLQNASDDQLMNMLRRPDKIPSQFIVAEINRRQAMRQAAQAQQRNMTTMQAPQQPMAQEMPVKRMNAGGMPYTPMQTISEFGGLTNVGSAKPKAKPSNDIDFSATTEVINNAYEAFKPDLETDGGVKDSPKKEVNTDTGIKVTATDVVLPGRVKSDVTQVTAKDVAAPSKTDTSGIRNLVDNINTKVDDGPSQQSLTANAVLANNVDRNAIKKSQEKLSETQRVRLSGLEKEFDNVANAMEELASVYDKNTKTPENRFYRSLIDMGIDLMASPEANFMTALGKSAKTGLATFDRLNDEAKKNLFAKYKATVDLATTKANLKGQLIDASNAIDQGEFDTNTALTNSKIADRATVVAAAKDDKGLNLSELGLGLDGTRTGIAALTSVANLQQGDNQLAANVETGNANRGVTAQSANQSANLTASGQEISQRATDINTLNANADRQIRAEVANLGDERAAKGQEITIQGQRIADENQDENRKLTAVNNWIDSLQKSDANKLAKIANEKPAANVEFLDNLIENKEDLGLTDEDIKTYIVGGKGTDPSAFNSVMTNASSVAAKLAGTFMDEQGLTGGVVLRDSRGQPIPFDNGEKYSLNTVNSYFLNKQLELLGLTGGQSRVYDPETKTTN